eukprot:TRINITY_DN96_c0_g1_i1.p2 TRINITY_DN96_c0_g1~~TRINITY_DN96_c0_g1_i1.p2  ORF type:complete len:269 (+),score=54.24 TRINITY_DN96_c0_g1_i1:30-809(+)
MSVSCLFRGFKNGKGSPISHCNRWLTVQAQPAAVVQPEQERSVAQKQPKQTTKLKKPLNRYHLFMREAFSKISKEEKGNPIMQKIAAQWKAMSEQEKQPYAEQAEKLKKEFEQLNPVQRPVKSLKRAPSGYQIFLKEKKPDVKQQNPDMRPVDLRRELSTQWKALNETQKQEYKQKALKELFLSEEKNPEKALSADQEKIDVKKEEENKNDVGLQEETQGAKVTVPAESQMSQDEILEKQVKAALTNSKNKEHNNSKKK